MKIVYAALAVAGFFVPIVTSIPFSLQHGADAGQLGRLKHLRDEDAVGLEHDGRVRPAAAVEAHLIADRGPQRGLRFRGNAAGQAAGREPARLQH